MEVEQIVEMFSKNLIFYLPIFIYILMVLFFPVTGNYSINDDWIFYRQIQHTLVSGDFKVSSLIDPSFIFQFLVGYSWSSLFGLSFGNLRILSIFFALGFFLVSLKILKLPKLSVFGTVLTLSVVVFNPLIFYSSLSFMTEIYFLFLISLSVFFLIKDLNSPKFVLGLNLYMGLLFAGMSFLQRQYGVAIFISFALTNLFLFLTKKLSKIDFYKRTFLIIFSFSVFFVFYLLWPRYENIEGEANLVSNLANLDNILENVQKVPQTITYFIFFLAPLLFPILRINFSDKLSKIILVLSFLASTYIIFSYNIFPLGNIFYLEGFSLKSDYRPVVSLGNLAIFKLLVASILSYLISLILVHLYSLIRKFKFKNRLSITLKELDLFLLGTSFISFILIFLGNDFYDRYLLPSIFYLIIFLTFKFQGIYSSLKFSFKNLHVFFLFFWISVSVLLNYEFFKTQDLVWKIAGRIQEERRIYLSLYSDDTRSKFLASQRHSSFTGNEKLIYPTKDALCFVQKYSKNDDSNLLIGLDKIIEKILDNPRIYDAKKKESPRITKNLKNVLHQETFFSPLSTLVGSEVYIGGFCRIESK